MHKKSSSLSDQPSNASQAQARAGANESLPSESAGARLIQAAGQRCQKLSVLIPVYNEEHYIEQVLEEVFAAPLPDGIEREVIVVDDASTDRTRQRLRRFAQRFPQIQLFFHRVNQGKGAAIRSAVEQASGDLIVIQDADLEYDPSEYQRLLEPILAGHADVVYGSRFLASPYRRVLYFWHSLGNQFLTNLSNCFTDLNLTDMETCFKMARASILKTIPMRSNRFGIEPELTAKFARRGCRVYEIPISYRGRTYSQGKKITWWDGVKAIFTILYFSIVEDLYPAQYGRKAFHSLSNTHRIHGWVSDLVRPWTGQNVLELDAGLGELTLRLMPRDSYTVADHDPLCFDYLTNLYSHDSRVEVRHVDVGDPHGWADLNGRFDTVLCLNVLQSLKDDRQTLRMIYRSLQPGGRVCLLLPQGPWLHGSLDRSLGGLRRYRPADLACKLEEAGFLVEHEQAFNKVSVPFWALHSRILGSRKFSRVQLKIFDSAIWLWRRLDRLLPWPGLSLLAVGKKPGESVPISAKCHPAEAGAAEAR